MMTLGEALKLYLDLHLAGRPSHRSTQQVVRQHLGPWLDRDITSITRHEFLALKVSLKDTPCQFNNAIKAVKCAINYVLREGYCDGVNPLTLVRRYHRQARSRFCQSHEAQAVMDAILQAPIKLKVFLLLVACTSARPKEVLHMKWSSLGVWLVNNTEIFVWDKGRTKNGTIDYKPIPCQVWEYLLEMPKISEWVFPGQNPSRPWASCSYQKAWRQLRLFAGVPDLWVYDLRRTVGSWLSIHGENLQTVQHVLNHTSLQSTAVYARLNVQTVAGALQRHTDRLFAMSGQGGQHGDLHAPTVTGVRHLDSGLPVSHRTSARERIAG